LADFLLLLYVLTLLPGVHPPRRDLVTAALIGAAGFELLKLLLGSYFKGVASKSMYGAFGTPVALLLWINFTAKLVLFCAAWTATGRAAARGRVEEDSVSADAADPEEVGDSEEIGAGGSAGAVQARGAGAGGAVPGSGGSSVAPGGGSDRASAGRGGS
jgi:membrane protein